MIVISLVLGNGKTPDKFYKEIKDFEKTQDFCKIDYNCMIKKLQAPILNKYLAAITPYQAKYKKAVDPEIERKAAEAHNNKLNKRRSEYLKRLKLRKQDPPATVEQCKNHEDTINQLQTGSADWKFGRLQIFKDLNNKYRFCKCLNAVGWKKYDKNDSRAWFTWRSGNRWTPNATFYAFRLIKGCSGCYKNIPSQGFPGLKVFQKIDKIQIGITDRIGTTREGYFDRDKPSCLFDSKGFKAYNY